MSFELKRSQATTKKISLDLVQGFLNTLDGGTFKLEDAPYEVLNEGVPTNLAILLFCNEPQTVIPGAYIEFFKYADSGTLILEKKQITGSVLSQYHQMLEYLSHLSQPRTDAESPFDYKAMKELILNAIVHRDYQDQRPIKVELYSNAFVVSNPTSENDPANPRLLRAIIDMGLATGTGLGAKAIGEVEVDSTMGFVSMRIKANESYACTESVRNAAYLWSNAKKRQAINYLRSILSIYPHFEQVVNQIIEYSFLLGNEKIAKKVLADYTQYTGKEKSVQPYITMARIYLGQSKIPLARKYLQHLPPFKDLNEILAVVILKKKLLEFKSAHSIFRQFAETYSEEPQFLHEYSQVKVRLALKASPDTKSTLLKEALTLLRTAIAFGTVDTQKAWYWFDLAQVSIQMESPRKTVEDAFEAAIELLPRESLFKRTRESWVNANR